MNMHNDWYSESEPDWQQQQTQDEHAQREYIRARVLAIGEKIGSGMTTDRDQQEYLELMRQVGAI